MKWLLREYDQILMDWFRSIEMRASDFKKKITIYEICRLFNHKSLHYKNTIKKTHNQPDIHQPYLDKKQDDFYDDVENYINKRTSFTVTWTEFYPLDVRSYFTINQSKNSLKLNWKS